MKRATVRELRNHYSRLLGEIEAGEEILITRRGVAVAKLVPVDPVQTEPVNWSSAPEVKRDRRVETMPTREQMVEILKESGGKW